MTSTERGTVPVVLADHSLLLSYCIVERLVFSLLTGRDGVERLGLASRVAAKPRSTMVDHNRWKTRWLDILV